MLMHCELKQTWGWRRASLLAGFLLAVSVFSRAEQLPVRNYTAADGLPRDAVTRIEQDSRGFMWIIAGDGISRFDGYKFTNYTTDDGLPDRRVNDLLETRAGVYWMATASGLCRFNPTGISPTRVGESLSAPQGESGARPEPMFVVYNPTEKPIVFNALLEDETGVIWCATNEGLYRLDTSPNDEAKFHFVNLGMPVGSDEEKNATTLLKDRKGFLWIGTGRGALYRLAPDGRVERYADEQGLSLSRDDRAAVLDLLEDRDGHVWVGRRAGGLSRLVAEPDTSRALVAQTYLTKDGLASEWVTALYQTRDGKLWVATTEGLCLFVPSSNEREPSFRVYNAQNGICDYEVWDVTEDRDGNLWVASQCGATKVVRNGFTGYGLADGLAMLYVNSIFENRNGELFVINAPDPGRHINRFDGARFSSVLSNLPPSVKYHGWGWGQTILQDHLGEWWIPTGSGLYRFPQVNGIGELARSRPQFVRTMYEDSDRTETFRLYEDSRGDVWMATTGAHFSLLRWERAANVVHDHTAETGVPPKTDFTFFVEDGVGNLWISASEGGGLLRYRDGKFKRFTTADGVPPGWIIWLYLDRAGRLWIGSQLGGLNRIDDPTADTLRFVRYTTRDGLSSNNIRSVTEDAWGRIYVGTGHGVDRLDLETGNVKHYTIADGLPKGIIEYAYRDRHGTLWFGSPFGISRFTPAQNESSAAPTIYITGLRVEGAAQHVSELGETNLPQLELTSNQNQVSVDFVGLGASVGEELRYQYRLEGASENWSAPTAERTINFASLAPGAYRFMVRAVNADGRASQTPTSFTFNVAAPLWKRWWFWTLIALALGLTAFALYRRRVRRLLEVANMRTRIATDLHDDIGANLTRIAILSEVARQQLGGDGEEEDDSPLSSIARISRESVASMSDIVWAINPERDHLLDLVRRMRQHAEEVFTLRDIDLRFSAPDAAQNLRLSVDVRRDLFLIFKEAVNNTARHALCSQVRIDLRVTGSDLALEIADDGVGFDTSAESEGHGLMSMRRRAENLGGALIVDSIKGRGTTIRLEVPLVPSRHFT
jgi:signal transduction histidine kinase/ligand-binding sensor domain-containing protein